MSEAVERCRVAEIAFEVVSPQEALARHPFLEPHDLVGALWNPGDGDIDPSQLTQALAKGARDLGARVHRFRRVTGLQREAGGKWLATTDKGDFVGCEALLSERAQSAGRRIVTLMLDDAGDAEPPPMAVVWREGRRVGLVTSAAYGHAVRASLAMALVERDAAEPSTPIAIEMFGQMRNASIVSESPCDPTHARLRG